MFELDWAERNHVQLCWQILCKYIEMLQNLTPLQGQTVWCYDRGGGGT